MPRKMKDENGNEIEVFTAEELALAKKEVDSSYRSKLGLSESDDIDQGINSLKGKENQDIRILREKKEETIRKEREKVISDLNNKGVKANYDESGNLVIDGNQSMTVEQIQEIVNKTNSDNSYKSEKNSFISSLDEAKRKDVESYMDSLKEKNISGDTSQIFKMAIAALGVPAPQNMSFNNQMHGQRPDGDSRFRGGDFSDTEAGKRILSAMGVSAEMVKRGEELKDSERIIKEGRISAESDVPGAIGAGNIANNHDSIK